MKQTEPSVACVTIRVHNGTAVLQALEAAGHTLLLDYIPLMVLEQDHRAIGICNGHHSAT